MDTARAKSELTGGRFAALEWVDATGSTNSDLLERAREGAHEQVLGARHQLAGRGRLGRVWQAPPDASLLCSVLVRPDLDAADLGAVTSALGLAASDACREVAGVTARLKWPNDLVVHVGSADGGSDRKVAGILAESVLASGRVEAVVAGIGLNVNWPDELPEDLAPIATSLRHVAERDVDPTDLLVALLRGFEARLAAAEAEGPGALRADYLAASATLGRRVRVERPDGELIGHAVDVDDSGALLVDDEAGTRHVVAAGDVIHLRPL